MQRQDNNQPGLCQDRIPVEVAPGSKRSRRQDTGFGVQLVKKNLADVRRRHFIPLKRMSRLFGRSSFGAIEGTSVWFVREGLGQRSFQVKGLLGRKSLVLSGPFAAHKRLILFVNGG